MVLTLFWSPTSIQWSLLFSLIFSDSEDKNLFLFLFKFHLLKDHFTFYVQMSFGNKVLPLYFKALNCCFWLSSVLHVWSQPYFKSHLLVTIFLYFCMFYLKPDWILFFIEPSWTTFDFHSSFSLDCHFSIAMYQKFNPPGTIPSHQEKKPCCLPNILPQIK